MTALVFTSNFRVNSILKSKDFFYYFTNKYLANLTLLVKNKQWASPNDQQQ